MAQQAILAAHRRDRESKSNSGIGASPTRKLVVSSSLQASLKSQSARLYQLFKLWDEDGSGAIDEQEFRHAIKMLGVKTSPTDFEALCRLCSADGKDTREVTLVGLTKLLDREFEAAPAEAGARRPKRKRQGLLRRACGSLYWLVNTISMQTLLYFVFVVMFQVRAPLPAHYAHRPAHDPRRSSPT